MIKNLEQLKEATNIVDIISEFVPLKKVGSNFMGCCPFHAEKSASFCVNSQKQFFNCFGCGEGGDAIKFIQKIKNVDFTQAAEIIAQKINFKLEIVGGNYPKISEYNEFLENFQNDYLMPQLQRDNSLIKYLNNRGLDYSDFEKFSLGAFGDFYSMLNYLKKVNKVDFALKIGLIFESQNKKGEYFSIFHNRISFALRNSNHKIIGFSARSHPYYNFKNRAKYLNSRESFLFKKSQCLYNLSLAKSTIQKTKEAIIVEGFLDSIAAHKGGLTNCVATCGTAFNGEHLAQLFKINNPRLNLLFDNDEAGQKAAIRTLKTAFKNSLYNSQIIQIKGDFKDLGEILQKAHKEQKELDLNSHLEYKDGFKFYLENATKNKIPQEKDAFINKLKSRLNQMPNYYTKQDLIKRAAEFFELNESFFLSAEKKVSFVGFDTQSAVLKTILSNKEALNIASAFINADFLGDLSADYLAYKTSGEITQKAAFILAQENIKELNLADFSRNLYALKKAALKEAQQKAKKEKNNFKLAQIAIQIAELENALNIPF